MENRRHAARRSMTMGALLVVLVLATVLVATSIVRRQRPAASQHPQIRLANEVLDAASGPGDPLPLAPPLVGASRSVWDGIEGSDRSDATRRWTLATVSLGFLAALVVRFYVVRRRRRPGSDERSADPSTQDVVHGEDSSMALPHRVEPGTEQEAPTPAIAGTKSREQLDGRDSRPAIDKEPSTDYRPAPYEVLVKLIGHVECDGREISGLGLEILAILACSRERSILNSDLVRNTLDRDDNPGTVPNNLSRLRRSLGEANDGSELLTRASGGRYADGAFELSSLVLTDIDLLKHRYDAACELSSLDAIEVLRGGLSLLRGPLFRARRGYDWVAPEGVLIRSQRVVLDYCTRLAHLAAEAGDLTLVYESICLGGNAVDDPVVELSMRQVEQHYADLTGDTSLIESARTAQARFNESLSGPAVVPSGSND